MGCEWKCSCIACSTNSRPEEFDCQCTCRFWIVVCAVVVLGFAVLFLSAVAYRKTILYLLSSGAVFFSGSLLTLAIITENCIWPAFFSIMLVFAFPCFYSCCWNRQLRRNELIQGHAPSVAPPETTTAPSTSRTENKPTSAVVMLFPDGGMQLGVQEMEMVQQTPSNEDLNKDETQGSSSNQPAVD